jgi:hypothetical protein
MRIAVELDLDITYCEYSRGIELEAVRFPGETLNLLPHMDSMARINVQAEVEAAVEKAALEKAIAIAERREMAGDHRRDLARDESMLAGHARAAHAAIFGSKV